MPKPLFPKWFAYFSIATFLGVWPGIMAGLFKTGPLAWNGAITHAFSAVTFIGWYVSMSVFLMRVPSEAREAETPLAVI